jgi:hypothetical protein
MKRKPASRYRKTRARDVVHVEDLVPRKPVVGGIGKLLFGERLDPRAHDSAEETEAKDRRN